MGKYFILFILFPLITYSQGGFGVDSNKTLDNGKIRFGNGSLTSVIASGIVRQPFYFNSSTNAWRKLTYSNYSLNSSFGVGGTGTNTWNINGTVGSDGSMSNQQFNTSGFTVTSGSKGYGTITWWISLFGFFTNGSS